LNLHLGARVPEAGKKKLFFANPWAIAFTTPIGAGNAYAVSAGSDLLVKLNVDGVGNLGFTGGEQTTRYVDLNDPNDPATSGDNAGKNPQGIAITADGAWAYVANVVSRNVSVVDLRLDRVVQVVRTAALPEPGSDAEKVAVGAEMFFSSRGHFDRPPHATVSTDERLSSEGWQNCASCHFEGLTDGVVWSFGPGPRKSIAMNGTFNPNNPEQQRILNYSAQRDEVQDFELNVRNVSGPGPLPAPVPCSAPPPDTSTFDPNHGLLLGDADFNQPPCVIADFVKPNGGRDQVTVTLPGSNTPVPALDALETWFRFAIRTPDGPLTDAEIAGGASAADIAEGRQLFEQQQCTSCHRGGLWSVSVRDFAPPPALTDIFCERNVNNPALPNCATDPVVGNPNAGQYLDRFLREVGSYNRGVAGQGNELGANIGAIEKAAAAVVGGVAQAQQDGLGIDFNNDGAGAGFAVSSLLGIHASPPYGHNGSCETVACVVADVNHRTALGTLPDLLADPGRQAKVARFVESIDADTEPFR
jgi:cytochrome c peroxidase